MGATDKERIADQQRQQEAMGLRLRGYTWQEIADEVGYSSRQAAQRGVAAMLDRVEEENVDEYRTVEGARLDLLWRHGIEHLAAMKPTGSPAAVTAAATAISSLARVSERRAKLYGLDAPTRVDVGVGDVDLDGTVQKIMAAFAAGEDSVGGDDGAAGDQ